MKQNLFWACLSMAAAVSLGAMGAHFLKTNLNADSLASFQTGVRYHLIHSLSILILSMASIRNGTSLIGPIRLMWIGMLMFSVSIYALSTRSLLGMDGQLLFLGPITPVGGLLMIASWIWSAAAFLRPNQDENKAIDEYL